MNLTIKIRNGHRNTAVASRFSSLLTADSALFTSFSPFSPATTFSPPSGSTHWFFQGPPAESKFLAVSSLTKKWFLVLAVLFLAFGATQAQSDQKPTVARAAFWMDESLKTEVYLIENRAGKGGYGLMVSGSENVKIFYHTRINSTQPVLEELTPVKVINGRRYYEFEHNFSRTTSWMALEFKLKDKRIESLTRKFRGDLFKTVPNDQFSADLPK